MKHLMFASIALLLLGGTAYSQTQLSGSFTQSNSYTGGTTTVTFTIVLSNDTTGAYSGTWTNTNGDSGTYAILPGGITGRWTSHTGDSGELGWDTGRDKWSWTQSNAPFHSGWIY